MASTEIRERRRTLRYRNLLVRQAVQMKNKVAVLLMEAGVSYSKQKLPKVGYFRELLATNQDIDEGVRSLLRLCHETVACLHPDDRAVRPHHPIADLKIGFFRTQLANRFFNSLPFVRVNLRN
jgi:transposase